MANNPKVSIILPTYNGSKFIRRSIESVLVQSFVNFELLVIDDGSTDSTAEIIQEAARNDSRVVYLKNEKNLGIQKTLNKGLKEAKGEYIARIDDDDLWVDEDKLKNQTEFLDTHPDYVLVGTGVIIQNEEGAELFRFLNIQNDEEIRRSLLGKNCFTHSSVMFKKSAAMKFGGYDESQETRHIEDYDLWLKLGTIGKLANLPYYSVRFTLRSGNISSKNKTIQFRKDLEMIKKYKKYYPNYLNAYLRGYLRLIFYGVFNVLPLAALKNKILRIYKQN